MKNNIELYDLLEEEQRLERMLKIADDEKRGIENGMRMISEEIQRIVHSEGVQP